jgi:hypothetical protein
MILLLDGPIIHALIAAGLAASVAITSVTMHPREMDFLLTLIRPIAPVAAIPILWILFQMWPSDTFAIAHPIWESAEAALGHPVGGSISIDRSATLLALTQYLTTLSIVVIAAAVAIDRSRAEWILFALVGATALIAVEVIVDALLGLNFLGDNTGSMSRAAATDCVALGIIISSTGAIRTFERYETRQSSPERSVRHLLLTFVACIGAMALCTLALSVGITGNSIFATVYGAVTLLAVLLVRRFGLGAWSCSAITATAIAVGLFLIATQSAIRATDFTLAFAPQAPTSITSTTQRILADANWTGTGAGSFAAITPIYRAVDDVGTASVAPTAAAKIAIELGWPMLWATGLFAVFCIFALLRGALRRGRDSFYPATGASCLVAVVLLSFGNVGFFGTSSSIIVAAVLGLALAQRKSRSTL